MALSGTNGDDISKIKDQAILLQSKGEDKPFPLMTESKLSNKVENLVIAEEG